MSQVNPSIVPGFSESAIVVQVKTWLPSGISAPPTVVEMKAKGVQNFEKPPDLTVRVYGSPADID